MKKKHLKFPNTKISETLLEFSSPLLDATGQAATKNQVEKVLQITYSVWNSIVLDKVRGGEKKYFDAKGDDKSRSNRFLNDRTVNLSKDGVICR
ncbi:MAG: hypothetical protein JRF56_21960 [Deltaproteobacteria bacterium]|jgi:DNA-binding HxlR family transcriptional regulator|nr:hypothetical protein [Deltaproteobacteria bacterium]